MAKKIRDEGEAFGSDSFLDIVANTVGILIILVLIAGLRAKNAPAGAQMTDDQLAEMAALELETTNLTAEVENLDDELKQAAVVSESRRRERDSLVMLEAQAQKMLDDKRNTLGARQQEEYDLRRQLADRERSLDRLSRDLQDAAATPSEKAVEIDNYPTPISRAVHGHEAHFQLRHGRICAVPIDAAMEQIRHDINRTKRKLESMDEVVETIGPVGDFRVQYIMSKIPISTTQAAIDVSFSMLPLSDPQGETLERAMSPRSDFRDAIAKVNPRHTTITLWAYPDSFAIYRTLKKELYKQGFAVAGRPIPMSQPVGGSSQGSKSAAE
jgi:hypothetical protein